VRILEPAFELGGEALEGAGLLLDRTGQPARDRVDEHHRRQVAVRQDVRADRDRVEARCCTTRSSKPSNRADKSVRRSSPASSSTTSCVNWRPCGEERDDAMLGDPP
jgi:hypothetical protein